MNYLGIDFHKHESRVVAIANDRVVAHEACAENTNPSELAQQYIKSETIGNYFTIYDVFDEHLDVVPVNPLKTWRIAEPNQNIGCADVIS